MRSSDTAILEEQQRSDCLLPGSRLWPPASRRKKGETTFQSAQLSPIHGRLSGYQRQECSRCRAWLCRRYWGCVAIAGTIECSTNAPISGDHVAFSGKIQLLVSKFGRSSKPIPRYIIVVSVPSPVCDVDREAYSLLQTGKAVHIIETSQKDGRISITLDRKIPLVTIKSIGLSSLRDDWMVRRISAVFEARLLNSGTVSERGYL